jgi:hypothetical protein
MSGMSQLHVASEPACARGVDLALLGHLLESQLAASCLAASGFGRLWRDHIVPLAVGNHCDWAIGFTARICGLTSDAGQPFNGRTGRILGDTGRGRWEVLLSFNTKGRWEVLNVKPDNLQAARPYDILRMWRQLPLATHFRVRETARLMKAAGNTNPLPVTVRLAGPERMPYHRIVNLHSTCNASMPFTERFPSPFVAGALGLSWCG